MNLGTNNNIIAMNIRRTIGRNVSSSVSQIESLGSGLRIKRAENDASGVTLSEGFRSELVKLTQNVRNAEQANDMMRVAEGSLGEVGNILQKMRTLAVQASTSTLTNRQRDVIAAEFNQERLAIDRIAQATVYNSRILLAGFVVVDKDASTAVADSADTGVIDFRFSGANRGSYNFIDSAADSTLTLGNGVTTQTIDLSTILDNGAVAAGTKVIANFDRLGIGVILAGTGTNKPANVGDYVAGDLDAKSLIVQDTVGGLFHISPSVDGAAQLSFNLPDIRAGSTILNLDTVSLSSQSSARKSIAPLDQAIEAVSLERGKMGAISNRLNHSISFSENELLNIGDSESTIRDTDVALATTALTRAQILTQHSTGMLAQSLNAGRNLLQLI